MTHSTEVEPFTARSGDKKVTSRRRKSANSDGSFIADLRDLGHFGLWRRRGALVGKFLTPLSLPQCSPEGMLDPRPWRDARDDTRALFYHRATRAYAHTNGLTYRGLTLRLSKRVEMLARAQGKQCLEFLRRRFVLHLKRATFSGSVCRAWWFSIEEDEKGALHIHGEIAFRPEDRRLVRKALCGAGGKWLVPSKVGRDGRKRSPWQLRFSPGEPDYGWAGYVLKDAGKGELGVA